MAPSWELSRAFLRSRWRMVLGLSIFVVAASLFWHQGMATSSQQMLLDSLGKTVKHSAERDQVDAIISRAKDFANHPLDDTKFGEMGNRTQQMREWLVLQETKKIEPDQIQALEKSLEAALLSSFPFLRTTQNPQDPTPFKSMRARRTPGSKGIVIPAGRDTFRYACHLIKSLREVLESHLPIQVVYAGDEDLTAPQREFLAKQTDVETVDITTILDNSLLNLEDVGWAIKAFALLVSKFEQTVLVDADAVFFQAPEKILQHPAYLQAGTLLFHDRLLWQGAFKDRHAWWESELRGFPPSATLNKSKVYNDGYAEEGDSGVVVLNTAKIEHFMALLHICWQNSPGPRKTSYTQGHGDKETWWFGLELAGAPYAFEDNYGAVLGHLENPGPAQKVCGFTIAHLDALKKLLWYNGSLLKNKVVDQTKYDVPDSWMVDAIWEKGATKADLSCMRDGKVNKLTFEEENVIRKSVKLAQEFDKTLKDLK